METSAETTAILNNTILEYLPNTTHREASKN